MGQLARGIGGGMDNLQSGFNPAGGFGDATTFGKGFLSNPMQGKGGLSGFLSKTPADSGVSRNVYQQLGGGADMAQVATKPGFVESIGNKISSLIPESTLGKIALGGGAVALGTALLGMGPQEVESAIMSRGEGLDIAGIRAEVTEAFKDQTGEKLLALRSKYPYLGTQASKNTAIMAYGGRIRRAEGGLMNLGGMEKDYRAEGGFVPIGAKEKADDVPARLSVNEFVFTADAVRSAGGGDIDKGAEVMERVMKNLEAGGQISEDSQGMQGAREMFQTSQRLGEVL